MTRNFNLLRNMTNGKKFPIESHSDIDNNKYSHLESNHEPKESGILSSVLLQHLMTINIKNYDRTDSLSLGDSPTLV